AKALGLLRQVARGREDVTGGLAGFHGGHGDAADRVRDVVRLLGRLLHRTVDLARRRLLLLDRGGDRGRDAVDALDGRENGADGGDGAGARALHALDLARDLVRGA